MEGVRAACPEPVGRGALTFGTRRRVSLQICHPKPPENFRGASDPLSIPDFETLFDTIARRTTPEKINFTCSRRLIQAHAQIKRGARHVPNINVVA